MANLGGPNRLLNSAEVGELLGLPERTIGAEWKRWGCRPTASAGLSAGASVTVLTSRCPSHWLTSPSGCPRPSSADANACRRLNPQPASAHQPDRDAHASATAVTWVKAGKTKSLLSPFGTPSYSSMFAHLCSASLPPFTAASRVPTMTWRAPSWANLVRKSAGGL